MDFLAKLFGGSVLGGVKDLIGKFKLDPETKAKLELAFEQNKHEVLSWEFELKQKALAIEAETIKQSSENIRAEAQSGDKFVSRARPTFLYLMYFILAWNYILIPIVQMVQSTPLKPLDLPSDLFMLFGAGYLGYSGFRSMDKNGFSFGGKK